MRTPSFCLERSTELRAYLHDGDVRLGMLLLLLLLTGNGVAGDAMRCDAMRRCRGRGCENKTFGMAASLQATHSTGAVRERPHGTGDLYGVCPRVQLDLASSTKES
jgi:hypothetical protein